MTGRRVIMGTLSAAVLALAVAAGVATQSQSEPEPEPFYPGQGASAIADEAVDWLEDNCWKDSEGSVHCG